tara:strand:- start:151 stop:366 length:216 start_codon:yes stop_codon:yes gene_type:complete
MKFKNKLKNIKKESFKIVFKKEIDEILFWYDKKDNSIVVSSLYHYGSPDSYELNDTKELIRLYEEYENLIK